MSRSVRVLFLVAVVLGVLALVSLLGQARDPNGAVCGSSLRWYAGHGTLHGGERSAAQLAAEAAQCRRSATHHAHRAEALIVAAGGITVVLLAARRRMSASAPSERLRGVTAEPSG